jgi:cytochrome c553
VITASRHLLIVAAAAAFGAFSGPAANAEGDPQQGRLLAYTCLGCHGIEGYRNAYPSYRVPKLGGQKHGYLEAALKAYRAGTRPHPTMQAQGNGLSDQEIEDLAAWFEGAEPATDDMTSESIAGFEAVQTCLACHGAQGEAVTPTPPTLSGQHQDYLIHALYQYKNGARGGTVMSAFAASLSDDDIEKIAYYYSSQDGLDTPEVDK